MLKQLRGLSWSSSSAAQRHPFTLFPRSRSAFNLWMWSSYLFLHPHPLVLQSIDCVSIGNEIHSMPASQCATRFVRLGKNVSHSLCSHQIIQWCFWYFEPSNHYDSSKFTFASFYFFCSTWRWRGRIWKRRCVCAYNNGNNLFRSFRAFVVYLIPVHCCLLQFMKHLNSDIIFLLRFRCFCLRSIQLCSLRWEGRLRSANGSRVFPKKERKKKNRANLNRIIWRFSPSSASCWQSTVVAAAACDSCISLSQFRSIHKWWKDAEVE